jgi:hypothetical protein
MLTVMPFIHGGSQEAEEEREAETVEHQVKYWQLQCPRTGSGPTDVYMAANGDDGYITGPTKEFYQMAHCTASNQVSKPYKRLQSQIQSIE